MSRARVPLRVPPGGSVHVSLFVAVVMLGCTVAPAFSAPSHNGRAPFFPKVGSDNEALIDTDSDLDTGCVFKDRGPLTIDLPIERFIGTTDNDGHVKSSLVSRDAVGEQAYLFMPAWDIDEPQEVDEVYLNGQKVGTMKGSDGTWRLNVFEVPVELLKFPKTSSDPGGVNQIRVEIDTATSGSNWCLEVDWVAIQFEAVHPLIFFHGIGAGPDAWENAGVRQHLESLGIPHRTQIQLPKRGTVETNGLVVAEQIRSTAAEYNVNKVHLVGQSKGGLDARYYLSNLYRSRQADHNPDGIEVLSLHTLSTPHHGSVLAVMSTAFRNGTVQNTDEDPQVDAYLDNAQFLGFAIGPARPGITNLEPSFLETFNADNRLPRGVFFGSTGADASTTGQQSLQALETRPLLPRPPLGLNNGAAARRGTVLYQTLGRIRTATATILRQGSPGRRPRLTGITVDRSSSFLLNDMAVTIGSSRLGDELHWNRIENNGPITDEADALNHAAIKDPEAVDWILENIITNGLD